MTTTLRPTSTSAASSGAALREAAPEERRRYHRRKITAFLLACAGWLLLLGAWEISSRTGLVDSSFASAPSAIAAKLFELITTGEIIPDILATAKTMAIGLALGIGFGVPCGICFAWFNTLDKMTGSVIDAMYSLPYVAFVPLVIIWFGIGDAGRIALVAWATFFPVLLNTIGGVRNLDRSFLRVAKGFCAGQLKTITTVVLPGSLPYVLTGVRLGVGRALVAAIVAEFFMSSAGLGYFISHSTSGLQMDAAFAALSITGALGILLVRVTTVVENRFGSWSRAD